MFAAPCLGGSPRGRANPFSLGFFPRCTIPIAPRIAAHSRLTPPESHPYKKHRPPGRRRMPALEHELVELGFALAVSGVIEEPVERGAVQIFSADLHGLDLRGVVNVSEGIGGKQDEVGALSRSNPAKLIGAAEKVGRAQRGGLQGGQRSKAGFDE